VHNLGKPPRMLVMLHLDGSVDRPSTGDAVLAGGRAIGRLGTVVDHVDLGPVALALLKRGLPADTDLRTGQEAAVAAVIDADSLPSAEHIGAGRLAVERAGAADAPPRSTVNCRQDNNDTKRSEPPTC
jgi:tRNA-modifying protein YgfZ